MNKAIIVGALALGLAGVVPVHAQSSDSTAKAFVQKWDRSGKGLLDMKAVLNAAMVKFEMLDAAHKGRLTEQQLSYAVSAADFKRANPDGDTTIGAEEWFDLVRAHFYAANPDNDGSLSVDELETPAGKALLRLLQ